MSYQPPTTIWEVDRQLKFNEPLTENDPRYVHTEAGRGDFSFGPLLKTLGVNPVDLQLMLPPDKVYCVFCGHRGCGKSTELRRLRVRLDDPARFFVVFLDATVDLDPHNLRYADVLLALAKQLFGQLQAKGLPIPQVFLSNLETWFSERIASNEKTKALAAEIKTGVSGEGGIPFLFKLFGELTNAIRINSTYKEELRSVVRNSFTQFADAFNLFIGAVEDEIKRADRGRKLLFIIDDTDRLTGEDSKRFFIEDVHQLQLIKSNFVYYAPIHLLLNNIQVHQSFDHFILPMIKLETKGGAGRFDPGYEVLRDMVYKRADRSLFDADSTVDTIIQHSGGNPRELMKILHYAFQRTETDRFDQEAVDKAIDDLATDYRRILDTDDYRILYEIDQSPDSDSTSERVRFLLYNLALLEYNGYWRHSHPVVRRLAAYQALSP
jgi:hypothetical protein